MEVSGYAQCSRQLKEYEAMWRETVKEVLDEQAGRIKSRMQAEHKWVNRTGDAEQGLDCASYQFGKNHFGLVASHGPDIFYARYLEYSHQQRFAVLEPTMRSQWPTTCRKIAEAVRRGSQSHGSRS